MNIYKNKFTNEGVNHLIGEVSGFSKRKGIIGGHNFEMFKKYFEDNNIPYKIINRVNHEIEGILDLFYVIGAKNYKGEYEKNKWQVKTYSKTVYIHSKIDSDTLVWWCYRALINSDVEIVNNQYYVKGIAENGLKFEGWLDTEGKIYRTYSIFNKWKY